MRYSVALLTALLLSAVPTARVLFRVEDPSGAALKNELIIVQNLDDHEREIFRGLTDKDGTVAPLEVRSGGLYRVIATAPYGLWQTAVREFLASGAPAEIVLSVAPNPTHGSGDVAVVGASRLDLRILRSDGAPASGATVLARDRDATLYLERYYKTNSQGKVRVEVLSNPLIVVVVYGDILVTKEISKNEGTVLIRLPTR